MAIGDQLFVKMLELHSAALQRVYVHRGAGTDGISRHAGAVGGDDDCIGDAKDGGIGIGPGTVPNQPVVAGRCPQRGQCSGRRAAGKRQQGHPTRRHQPSDRCRDRLDIIWTKRIRFAASTDEHCYPFALASCPALFVVPGVCGVCDRSSGQPVKRRFGDNQVAVQRCTRVIMRWSNNRIKAQPACKRCLQENRRTIGARTALDGERRARSSPPCGDQHLRPRGGEWRIISCKA